MENKGIKDMCIHIGKYMVMATFEKVETVNAPSKIIIDQGWNPNLKNLAQDFKYQIEVHKLPGFVTDSKIQKRNWKEMANF
jgi:hypothetical protein